MATFFGITPKTMSDEELAVATASYRLIRFTRQQPTASRADLLWMWPVLACLLLTVVWFKRRYAED